jgi:TIGR00251 family protein
MPFADAIRATKDGVVIDFEVSPGAKSAEVPSGYNTWRKRIEAKIRSPPEKGRANEELIEALADLFNVSAASVEIVSGAANSRKSILVRGLAVADVVRALEGTLGDG